MMNVILSDKPVDIFSFDKFFLDCNIGQAIIFKGRWSRVYHLFTMNVDQGYKYFEKIRGGLHCYTMGSRDFFSIISFVLRNAKGKLVSFNRKIITFCLSIKEVQFFSRKNYMPKTFLKSILRYNKPKWKPQVEINTSHLSSNQQTFKRNLLSGNLGSILYEDYLKLWKDLFTKI